MTDYNYDVFISYRRHPEWTPWTREHVLRLLDAYLTQDLGRPPRIFIDEGIKPGADWPARLGLALGSSRVLLPVFSRDYFSSDWCLHELDLMNQRLRQFPESQIIVPVIGHDGDLIPAEIARIAPCDLSKFRNTDLQRRTPRYEQFSDEVKALAPQVAAAIDSAPPHDEAWCVLSRARFESVYQAQCGGPHVAVETLTLKPMPYPTRPPQVRL